MSERVLVSNRFSGMCIFKYEDDYIFAKDKSDRGMKLSDAPVETLYKSMFSMIGLRESGEVLQYFSSEEDYESLRNKINEHVVMRNHEEFLEFETKKGWEPGSIIFSNTPLLMCYEKGEYLYIVLEHMEERQRLDTLSNEELKEFHSRFKGFREIDGSIAYCRSIGDIDKLVDYLETLI